MNDEPSGDAAEYEAPLIKKIDPDVAPAEGDYLLAGNPSLPPDVMAWMRKFDP